LSFLHIFQHSPITSFSERPLILHGAQDHKILA
jgi:hypothetical protein